MNSNVHSNGRCSPKWATNIFFIRQESITIQSQSKRGKRRSLKTQR